MCDGGGVNCHDCSGAPINPGDLLLVNSQIGDGICNDGNRICKSHTCNVNLNCAAYDFDNGDCDAETDADTDTTGAGSGSGVEPGAVAHCNFDGSGANACNRYSSSYCSVSLYTYCQGSVPSGMSTFADLVSCSCMVPVAHLAHTKCLPAYLVVTRVVRYDGHHD